MLIVEPIYVRLNVCDSSAFQTISIRSVYIKSINCSGIIFANLKKKNQCKQKNIQTKKKHTHIQIKKKIFRDYIFLLKDF